MSCLALGSSPTKSRKKKKKRHNNRSATCNNSAYSQNVKCDERSLRRVCKILVDFSQTAPSHLTDESQTQWPDTPPDHPQNKRAMVHLHLCSLDRPLGPSIQPEMSNSKQSEKIECHSQYYSFRTLTLFPSSRMTTSRGAFSRIVAIQLFKTKQNEKGCLQNTFAAVYTGQDVERQNPNS